MDQNPSPSKADRKTIEKNRRNQMKTLYSKLNSLVPHKSPREVVSLPDQLEGAANYIKKLEDDLERMKHKKNCLMGNSSTRSSTSTSGSGLINLPNVDVRVMGSALEVVLITGSNCQLMFSEIIRMLPEQGVEVVNASFSVVDDTVFHTLHCKVGESSQECDAARISDSLRKFLYDVNQ